MKKLLLLGVAALCLAGCSRVHPGHVGIKVSQWGGSAGVSNQVLGVGTYLTPLGTTIEEYPTYTSTSPFSGDDQISFQDKNGLSLSADVAVSYHADAAKVPILYQKYRTDMDGILAGPLRNTVRNAINTEAAKLGVEEIYGPKKAELAAAALRDAQAFFAPYGLVVEQVNWASTIRLPPQVLAQINQKIANEQAALAAQANVATATANANAQREQARGKADSMALEAAALRANPEMASLRAIEAWDGHLPTYMGGAGPLPFLGVK